MKRIFYLYKHGTLQRKDNSLCLIAKNGNVDYLPIQQIDSIICFSEITLNKRVLGLLNINKISIIFFDYYGNYIGRFQPKKYYNGKSLIQQISIYEDDKKRLYLSKAMILGSIKNMQAVAKYYLKKGKDVNKQILKLEECLNEIQQVNSLELLLIHEAKAKQIYYSIFDIILMCNTFKFDKRTKNPPKNEVNAMMSYGYSILYAIILSILDRSSLMPQISFIHSVNKNYDSLQYDIADIFKPVIIDRLILRLIRKNQIKQIYFDYKEDGRCYLNKEGIRIFVSNLDDTLKTTVRYNNQSYSYRSLLSKEIHKISKYIKGESLSYKAFVMKW